MASHEVFLTPSETMPTFGFIPWTRCVPAAFLVLLARMLVADAVGAVCTGDCDGDHEVEVNEPIIGVSIALGRAPLDTCVAFDANGDAVVAINELIAAVRNAFDGCPAQRTATATASRSVTSTPSPTPTATVNQPPALPPAPVYRTYPGFDIRLPVGARDPEGGAVRCSAADLPAGASFDEQSGVLSWMPAGDQLGPFYVPVSCADGAAPPASAAGQLTFKVAELDACAMPSCDPATGCTANLPPVDESCCAAGPTARVAEPAAGCPTGRVLFVGQNANRDTFGRLQNCDVMRVRNFQQSGAEVQFHIETRCVNTDEPVRLHARLESSAEFHPVFFDVETRAFRLSADDDGFARQRGLRFAIGGGGPFFDIQDAEANLTVTLTDADGVTVTDELRLRLSFTPQPDRPDVDPTPRAN